ncbi:MAG: Ig-like domain-containing protein [bacterium]
MNYSIKQNVHLIIALLLLFAWIGCDSDQRLVNPSEDAKVTLNIIFPQSASKASSEAGLHARSAIDQVTVSLVDVASRVAVIKEQRLRIVQTPQGRFAEGELSVPVSAGRQAFSIVVFANDSQNLRFFVGLATVSIEAGEVREEPVDISLQPAISIAGAGAVTASSIFQEGFEPGSAIDLDFGTSWFSAGPSADGNTSTFTWTSSQDVFIGTTGIFNNAFHDNPNFRTGFGFQGVTFQVFSGPDATGTMVFEEIADYPKTFPVVRVSPFVAGRSIRLLLNDHEDPSCGGFSELLIVGLDLSGGGPIRTLLTIAINPTNPTIDVGQTTQFNANGTFSDGSSNNITSLVTWASSNPSVASITASGLATGLASGTTTISATQGNVSNLTTLTVTTTLESIAVAPTDATIDVGQSAQFKATGTNTDGSTTDLTNQVTWASSNPSVATITATGIATGLAPGTTTISAAQGGLSDETSLTVNAAQLSGATISNFQAPLVQLNDSTNCDVFNGPIGSLFDFSFDYTDPDGDVTEGTVVNYSFVFSPSGQANSAEFTSAQITGDGFDGTMRLGLCVVYSDQTSIQHTVSITDAGGETSNSLSLDVAKPEGANLTLPQTAYWKSRRARPQVSVCRKP